MIKKLTPIGNSLGLIIDRPILELLKIDRDTPLEIRTDGNGLFVQPSHGDHSSRVREATARMMDAHEETLHQLAR